MANYESWKYCGHILENGKKCGVTADYSCEKSCKHTDEDYSGWATPPKKEDMSDHPKFLCNEHVEIYED